MRQSRDGRGVGGVGEGALLDDEAVTRALNLGVALQRVDDRRVARCRRIEAIDRRRHAAFFLALAAFAGFAGFFAQSCLLASRAPSARALNLVQMILGWTSVW